MEEGDDAQHTSGLVPIYRATENLSSRRIRTLVDEQLGHAGDAPDALPSEVRGRHRLPLRRDAIVAAHRPRTPRDAERARRRLAFEELFLLQVGLIRHRRELESAAVAPALGRPGRAVRGSAGDAAVHADGGPDPGDGRGGRRCRPHHPHAAAAAGRRRGGQDGRGRARAAAGGRARRPGSADGAHRDAVVAAPAEHLRLCEPLGVRVAPLVNGMPARKRRGPPCRWSSRASPDRGRHARPDQDGVVFGRARGCGGRRAAPVRRGPAAGAAREGRARAMSRICCNDRHADPAHAGADRYGDLDVSLLDELPPGRTPVVTRLVLAPARGEVFKRMRARCGRRPAGVWVCPLVVGRDAVAEARPPRRRPRLADGALRGCGSG